MNLKKSHHNWFLIDCDRLVNQKGLGFRTQSFELCIIFSKNISHDYVS